MIRIRARFLILRERGAFTPHPAGRHYVGRHRKEQES